MSIFIRRKVTISNNIVELFQSKHYEKYVLDIMNLSKNIFKDTYEKIEPDSHSEPDFTNGNGLFYDAKIPFNPEQINILTDGASHAPMIKDWLDQLSAEASDLNIDALRAGNYAVEDGVLYKIMYRQIKKELEQEKKYQKTYKENIVFFMPFLIGHTISNFVSQSSDYLDILFDSLSRKSELENLEGREIYIICPTGESPSSFLIRNLNKREREFIQYSGLVDYFTYELI